MATIAEVELMNRGFDRMADTLLRKRMLEEQAREREASRGERRAEQAESTRRFEAGMQLDRDKLTALEGQTRLSEKFKRISEATQDLQSSIKQFPDLARTGAYSNEELTAFLVQSAEAAGPEISGELRSKPQFKPFLEGKVDWAKIAPPKQPGQMETADTRNLARRLELEQAIAQAKSPEEKIQAERALELWKEERGNAGSRDELATLTESFPAEAGSPEVPGAPARQVGGFFGLGSRTIPAQPGRPGTPPTPARSITRRVPVGELDKSLAAEKPAGPGAGGPNPQVNAQALIEEANKAIAAGADAKQVKARLLEKYGIRVQ